jgi:hypothetical protein
MSFGATSTASWVVCLAVASPVAVAVLVVLVAVVFSPT